jgi:hypothetical protein
MDRFDDKRINEALELLNEVAREKKAELQAAVAHKYTDLASAMSACTGQVKERAFTGIRGPSLEAPPPRPFCAASCWADHTGSNA